MAIQLGSLVRDSISGFEGIATCRSEFLYGCVRISIAPKALHDGKPVGEEWFDEQRVELVEARPVAVSAASSATGGGPQTPRPPSGMAR